MPILYSVYVLMLTRSSTKCHAMVKMLIVEVTELSQLYDLGNIRKAGKFNKRVFLLKVTFPKGFKNCGLGLEM